jgi:hypothetical protein
MQRVRGSERRAYRRFGIEIPVKYILNDDFGWTSTLDLSSRCVFIKLDRSLPVGEKVTLILDWPAKLNENAALWLEIGGHVLRSDRTGSAISIGRHIYRVRPRRAV